MNTSGSGFQTLYSFLGGSSDGSRPDAGGLTLVGSTLYGTTRLGGSAGNGTLFSITTAGTGYQVVRSFLGGPTDGQNPSNGALTSVGSTLYGTTDLGGSSNEGTVFAINTAGTGFHSIHSFSARCGQTPNAGLVFTGSALFGTTQAGGSTAGDGTVFSLNTDGTGYQVVHSFSGTDGNSPDEGLALVGSTLFGTTYNHGGFNAGTLFSLSFVPTVNVTTSGSTGQTFTLGGSAVAVDSGITVTSTIPISPAPRK